MNNFQTILVAIFLAFFVFGVLIFSGILKIGNGSNGSNSISGKVVIWGPLPSSQVGELLQNIDNTNSGLSVEYVEQDALTYEQNLIEAFAKDKGPDLFILPSDMVLRNINFISSIPFANYPKKTFDSNFIDGANIFLTNTGVLGYPLLVDPLVLYYNKDMLSNESIVYPPATWDELFKLSSKLIKKNKDGTISQSMIAFGQYDNVNHAKDILSMLLLESNNPITTPIEKGYRSTIKDSASDGSNPMEQIVNFFLEFSNPSNESYSWNRSFPNSLDMFTSNKLAFYVGYASELFNIEAVNPNLSFNVSSIPQTQGMNVKRTYGKMYSIFVSKKATNIATAQVVGAMITDPAVLKELAIRTSLPSASRSLLAEKPEDSYLSTFFDSAIISRSWLDPNKDQTNLIFKELIENSLSNRLSVSASIEKAQSKLDLILSNIYE